MRKHVFSWMRNVDMKVVAFSSLLAFAAAPAVAENQQEGQPDDRAAMQQQDPSPAPQSGDAGIARDRDQARAQNRQQDQSGLGESEEDKLKPGSGLAEATVGALHGSEVVNANDEVIGSVRDIALSKQDDKPHAIIDVGGWLGIGGTQIAVPLDELEIKSEDQVAYNTSASQEQIEEQAQEYDEEQFVAHGDDEMQLSVYMKDGGQSGQDQSESQSDQAMAGQEQSEEDDAQVTVVQPDSEDEADQSSAQQPQSQDDQASAQIQSEDDSASAQPQDQDEDDQAVVVERESSDDQAAQPPRDDS